MGFLRYWEKMKRTQNPEYCVFQLDSVNSEGLRVDLHFWVGIQTE